MTSFALQWRSFTSGTLLLASYTEGPEATYQSAAKSLYESKTGPNGDLSICN
jgi:hypothetical protein